MEAVMSSIKSARIEEHFADLPIRGVARLLIR